MRALALDTTTRGGSVALVVDDRVVDQRAGDASRSHAERLPTELLRVGDAHGVAIAAVDLFAVAAGPGSFTGLRIGIATMQGLAFVERRPVIAVSALDALAQIAAMDLAPAAIVAAWIDAQRGDVYSAAYRVTSAPPFAPERLAAIAAPSVADPAAIVEEWARAGVAPARCVGDGAVRYAGTIAERLPDAAIAGAPLLAGAIGRIAIVRAQRGDTGHPAAVQPLYVRRPDAELDRERRALSP
ncbi:MAG TPA: tRNA (adenosine(37)-N6)-threonylcarbamoyltransferase complex dimerization subunit type 1 TsaB [Vicinamibacterales bacterium]|nr:tRNA (adenosine(37)-N6)-threonylcarbamoyltransferase complex dimerization subunit type 1 TsaB [Vicinamibacterales bacterium]